MNQGVAVVSGAKQYCNRNQLFEENLNLVKAIARHICVRLPPGQQLDDLVQVGLIGLLEASRVYDASLGASFKSYASIRIRGAIMDELRRQSWVPRSVQQKSRKLSEAIHAVEKREGRAATDREIAAEMNESLEQYGETLQMVTGCTVFSLDDEDNFFEPESTEDLPFNLFHDDAVKEKLASVIAGLPHQEKMVIALYYDKEMNLKEIGEVLDISESRVCQIHSQAVGRMRSRMQSWLRDAR
ncbi:MAG: RNA polymerase sigma factor FliA [Gammaproteobacteria bacterium]